MCTIKNDLQNTGLKCSGTGDEECKQCEYAVHTNAERIRNMTDEELAKFLTEYRACIACDYDNDEDVPCGMPNNMVCTKGYAEAVTLGWLRSESED